jgi:hypothetical protein
MRADHGRDCDDNAAFHRVLSVIFVMIGSGKCRSIGNAPQRNIRFFVVTESSAVTDDDSEWGTVMGR